MKGSGRILSTALPALFALGLGSLSIYGAVEGFFSAIWVLVTLLAVLCVYLIYRQFRNKDDSNVGQNFNI